MKEVFIVKGDASDYDDPCEFLIRAFDTEDEALSLVEKLNSWSKENDYYKCIDENVNVDWSNFPNEINIKYEYDENGIVGWLEFQEDMKGYIQKRIDINGGLSFGIRFSYYTVPFGYDK